MTQLLEFVRRSSGGKVVLASSDKLGEGGEAAVYTMASDPLLVAKIYKRPTSQRESKLQLMVANPPDDPSASSGHTSIAWPTELLYGRRGNFAGFVMPRIHDGHPLCDVYTPRVRKQWAPGFTYRYLCGAARNLAAATAAIHRAGYVVGDVNESNVTVNGRALVSFVDTDSFQVTDPARSATHRCLVGKPDFTPPELQGSEFAAIDRSAEHDRFGLAVLLFHLLFEGVHPFVGIYRGAGEPPDVGGRITMGEFIYCQTRSVGSIPPRHALAFETIHPALRELFIRAFDVGHRSPDRRPTAQEWLTAFSGTSAELKECSRNKQHQYWSHNATCPWCARAKAGLESFPEGALRMPTPISGSRVGSTPVAPAPFRGTPRANAVPIAMTPQATPAWNPPSAPVAQTRPTAFALALSGIRDSRTLLFAAGAAISGFVGADMANISSGPLAIIAIAPILVAYAALLRAVWKRSVNPLPVGFLVIIGLAVVSPLSEAMSAHRAGLADLGMAFISAGVSFGLSSWLSRGPKSDWLLHARIASLAAPMLVAVPFGAPKTIARPIPPAPKLVASSQPVSRPIVASPTPQGTATPVAPSAAPQEIDCDDSVCLFDEAGSDTPARAIPVGSKLSFLGPDQEGWCKVTVLSGRSGYLRTVDLPRIIPPPSSVNVVIP